MSEGEAVERPQFLALTGSEETGPVVKVVGVYQHREPHIQAQHFILLQDAEGRKLPIWIGQFEAWGIGYALEGKSYDRPLTFELIKILIGIGGLAVQYAHIDDLKEETFYSRLAVRKPDGSLLGVDVRASDAITLAIYFKAPVYVAEQMMATAGDSRDWNLGKN